MAEVQYVLRDPVTGHMEKVDASISDKVAAEKGWEYAKPEEIRLWASKKRYGGAGNTALAVGEAAVRGLTLGQVEGFGDEQDIRGRKAILEREHPGLAIAGELAPDIAVGLATGGVSALATGAGRAAAKQGLKQGVKQGVKQAVRASPKAALAGEALGGGAVAASQQAFDEGRKFLHEDIEADVRNLVLWTGVGGALGAAPGLVRAARGKLAKGAKKLDDAAQVTDDLAAAGEAAERRAVRETAPGAAGRVSKEVDTSEALERSVARGERAASQAEAEQVVREITGEGLEREAGGFMRNRRLAQNKDVILQTTQKEQRHAFNELNRAGREMLDEPNKIQLTRKNVGDNLPAQKAQAQRVALDAERLAGELRANAHALGAQLGKRGPKWFSSDAAKLAHSLRERAKELALVKDGAELFKGLDDFKRTVDDFKVSLEAGRNAAKDPKNFDELIPDVQKFVDKIRAGLEETPTWGKMGDYQRARNASFTDKLIPASRVFSEAAFKWTGKGYDAKPILDAWESKIDNLLANAETGERRHVGDMLEAYREMAEQALQFGTSDAKRASKVIELTRRIERGFGLADETTAAVGQMASVKTVADAAGTALGGVGGGAVGGLPGAFVGASLARGAGEFATGNLTRAFRTMRGATDLAVDRSVDDWIRSSKLRGKGPSRGSRAKGAAVRVLSHIDETERDLARAAARRGFTRSFAHFMGEHERPAIAFEAKRQALTDDEAFIENTSTMFGDLAEFSPEAYTLAASHIAEVRKFLTDRMPPNMAVSIMNPNGYPPSDEVIEDWSVYWNAATDPMSVVRSLRRGDVRPQQVETLRTIRAYRPLYEQIQQTILEKIAGQQASGPGGIDDQFLFRMNLLFDLDGAGSPAFSRRAAEAAMSAQQQAQPEPPRPPARTPENASRLSPASAALTGPTYGTQG